MSNALEKLTLAYLALLERADKLQADKDAMFFENQTLHHKYKTQKHENAELLRRLQFNSKFQNSIEKESSAQNEQIHNLKQCIEELESQLVQLTPKEQRIDEQADGYEASGRVCRADFKASETTDENTNVLHCKVTQNDGMQQAIIKTQKMVYVGTEPQAETTEKADEAIQPVILLANQYGTWVKSCFFVFDDKVKIKQFIFTTEIKEAKQFASLAAIGEFLSGCIGEKLQTSYHHPETLQLIPTEI